MDVLIDYITMTSRNDLRELVAFDKSFLEEKWITWRAGPAFYEGQSFGFNHGTLQLLFSKEQGTLIRVSGSLADELVLRNSTIIDKFQVSRIDLRLDVLTSIDLDFWYRIQRIRSRKVSCSLINGETLYIGSRKSDKFWRIYNKAREQMVGDIELFRIELELKGRRAKLLSGKVSDRKLLSDTFFANAIGIIPELLEELGLEGYLKEAPKIELPRRRPAGKFFFDNSVIPFLKKNGWAVDNIIALVMNKEIHGTASD